MQELKVVVVSGINQSQWSLALNFFSHLLGWHPASDRPWCTLYELLLIPRPCGDMLRLAWSLENLFAKLAETTSEWYLACVHSGDIKSARLLQDLLRHEMLLRWLVVRIKWIIFTHVAILRANLLLIAVILVLLVELRLEALPNRYFLFLFPRHHLLALFSGHASNL